jgi:hypothetical protein
MKKVWVISVRDQCKRARIPFFFKQWGGTRKAVAGRKLEGKTYYEFSPRSHNPVLAAEECILLASKIEGDFKRKDLLQVAGLKSTFLEPAVF